VWRAWDRLLEREVALKELIPLHEGVENLVKSRERARNEARMLARLEHPAIVSVHDLISVDDNPWIVMGYFRGVPLEDKFKASQPMSDQEVARFGLPILSGLMFAHAAGVVHRDVKPLNILIAPDSTVCLVDFGIAKPVGASTTGLLLLGTLEYMAPERLDGNSGEEPSDLWSLGVTFYYAMTKRSPFNRGSVAATTTAILRDDPPPPARSGPLADIVMRMLGKNPSRRPTGEQVAAVLRAALASGHPQAPSPAAPGPASGPQGGGQHPRHAGPGDGGTGIRRQPSWEPAPGQDTTAILSMSQADAVTALIATPTPASAARILSQCSHGYAGTLITAIAASHPQRAGRILESIDPERAGVILSRMNHRAASGILATMQPAEAARRLGEADTVAAGNALAALPDSEAWSIVYAMDDARASRVLSRVDPGKCAAILSTLPDAPRARLMGQLPPAFRRLVQRHE
jgi:hypothetical protein